MFGLGPIMPKKHRCATNLVLGTTKQRGHIFRRHKLKQQNIENEIHYENRKYHRTQFARAHLPRVRLEHVFAFHPHAAATGRPGA